MNGDSRKGDVSRMRREALDEKRKRLESLRAQKAGKDKIVAKKRHDVMQKTNSPVKKNIPIRSPGADIDDVVQTLLGDEARRNTDNTAQLTETEIADRDKRIKAAKMAALASQHNVVNINIPSKDVPTYDKGIQTASTGTDPAPAAGGLGAPPTPQPGQGQNRRRTSLDGGDLELTVPGDPVGGDAAKPDEDEDEFKIPVVSETEKSAMIASGEYTAFMAKASRVMERALVLGARVGGYDFTVDYAADESKDLSADKVAQEQCVFFDEVLCKNRAVTDISWSSKHSELVVVAYSDRLTGGTEEGQEGMVILWNVMTPSSPEMVFYCQSPVLRAFISQFNANFIVGSTYSGQIVVWDKTQMGGDHTLAMPTHRTPLSPHGHTLPVYSMDLVGTDNANSLVTVSTDGKMRAWNLQQLQKPQDPQIDLFYPSKDDKRMVAPGADKRTAVNEPLAVTCTSFVDGDANTCIMGGEDGDAFAVVRHTGSDAIAMRYPGHDGPITSVTCHPASGAQDFSGLFLSASMDWTLRLWDRKHTACLHTFEDANDYVYDVKWSPTHPAVFASVDGTGQLSIWNLNSDIDLPVGKIMVSKDRALNRVQWSRDGRRVAVGTSNGQCYVYEANKELAVPSQNDWRNLSQIVLELQVKSEEEASAATKA